MVSFLCLHLVIPFRASEQITLAALCLIQYVFQNSLGQAIVSYVLISTFLLSLSTARCRKLLNWIQFPQLSVVVSRTLRVSFALILAFLFVRTFPYLSTARGLQLSGEDLLLIQGSDGLARMLLDPLRLSLVIMATIFPLSVCIFPSSIYVFLIVFLLLSRTAIISLLISASSILVFKWWSISVSPPRVNGRGLPFFVILPAFLFCMYIFLVFIASFFTSDYLYSLASSYDVSMYRLLSPIDSSFVSRIIADVHVMEDVFVHFFQGGYPLIDNSNWLLNYLDSREIRVFTHSSYIEQLFLSGFFGVWVVVSILSLPILWLRMFLLTHQGLLSSGFDYYSTVVSASVFSLIYALMSIQGMVNIYFVMSMVWAYLIVGLYLSHRKPLLRTIDLLK